MELDVIYKRVVGLDVHQPQITACALIEKSDDSMRTEQRQFGAFQKDRRMLAQWAAQLQPDEVVMESTGGYAAICLLAEKTMCLPARHSCCFSTENCLTLYCKLP